MSVDRVAVNTLLGRGFWMLMNNQLVAIKVEVDPLGAGTTFFQAKYFTVKGACAREVVNRNCEVERREAHQNSNDSIFVGEGRGSVLMRAAGFW
ncbi:hypothetical protein D3C86_1618910 [compost metagenome]